MYMYIHLQVFLNYSIDYRPWQQVAASRRHQPPTHLRSYLPAYSAGKYGSV